MFKIGTIKMIGEKRSHNQMKEVSNIKDFKSKIKIS